MLSQRWRDSTARDVVLAVLLTVIVLVGTYGEAHPTQPANRGVPGHMVPPTPTAAMGLVAVATLVLIWRRRYPQTVLVVSLTATVAYTLLGYVNGAALVAPVVALYAVAAMVPLRRAIGWAVAVLGILMGSTAAGKPFGPTGGGFVLIPGEVAAALFLGLAVANRRAYIAAIQRRAEQDARARVDAERLRIARDLHDVVAHTMATINV